MKKSAAFSHVFFTFAFCFLLFLCAFRYLRLPLILSALFALAIACCAAALLAAFLGRKREKYLFSLRAEKEKEALFLYLSLSSPVRTLRFLSAAYPEAFGGAAEPALRSPASSEPPFVTVCDNLYKLQNLSEPHTAQTYFSFSSTPFPREKSEALIRSMNVFPNGNARADDSAAAASSFSPDCSAALYCAAAEEDAAALLTRFGVKIFTAEDIFARTKETGALPREAEELAKEKKVKKFVLRGVTKKTSRGLLISAGILLFTSLFSPFPYYYRALSLILLALSLAVRLLAVKPLSLPIPPEKKKKTNAEKTNDKTNGKNDLKR
ncbi:MAG: hypothetical protein SPH68_06415 [Candidatus Borkfalkiaceae bacterium]|nr:hypothetical protein [Christensenellaceae bacterium]